ncbi:MAG: Thioredoxin domain-containing protein 9, partial [Marteilia pararefringens]
RSTLISNGHGKVVELPSEKQLFEIYKESQSIVCLFYNHSEKRRMELLLKIMDSIAKSQIRLRFVTICSDRAPFLRKKQVISTPVEIIFIKEGSVLKHLDCDEWLRSEMPETAMESRLKELCEKFMKLKKRIVEN